MGIVKRLYLYGVAAISLLVLAAGIENLLAVALAEVADALGATVIAGESSGREQLSLAIALVVVGAPIFAIHWWLIARGWNGTDEAAADDRQSAIRAFHMALVATVSMAVALYAAQRLLEPLFGAILGVAPADAPWTDGAVPGNVALLLVAAPVWWFHMDRRNADLRHDRLVGASAWLTRLDRYGWAFVGLMTLLIGAGQLIQTVASALIGQPDISGSGDWSVGFIASSLAAIVAGGIVWWLHADDARRAIRDAALIGEDDRSTALRATYFGAVLLVALAIGGVTIAGSITELGRVLLGVADQTGVRPFLESVLGPLLVAVPFVVAGWLHWRVMRDEAAGAGTAALATAERLRLHLTALVGIIFLTVGAARLGALLVELVLGQVAGDDFLRREVVSCIAQILVGSVLWLPAWSAIVARRTTAPSTERLARIARAYLLLVVGGALIAVVPSAVFVLFRFINTLLGGVTNLGSDLPVPLAAVVVGAVVAAYHGRLVVSDMRLAAAEQPADTPPVASVEGPPLAVAPANLPLVLRGEAGEDLEAIAATLRGYLPPGVRLEAG
jgi:Domain of unknown function (DUF5671)